jgi:hypothetical protein
MWMQQPLPIFYFMKKKFFNTLVLVLLFMPGKIFAQQQDITGVWKGLLYVDSTKVYLPYEIAISDAKKNMTGYSRIIFFENGKEEAGYEELDIKWKGDQVVVEDQGFFEHSFTQKVVKRIKKTLLLSLTVSDTEMVLQGKWSTNRTRYYLAATGSVELKRKTDYKETALYKKLDTLKIAPKLAFTFTEKKSDVLIATTATAEKKTPDPDIEAEVESTTLPAIAAAGGITPILFVKKKQAAIAKVEPPKKERKAMYAYITKMAVNYKPKVVVPTVEKPDLATAAQPKPEKKTVAAPKPIPAEKKPDVVVQPVAPKPTPPLIAIIAPSVTQGAAELDKRVIKSEQAFYFETDSLVLTLYDNGEVDGDTVTVVMNGNIIFSKHGLSTKANSKTIYITPGMDSVKLVMYAESLGEIPPNTGLLIVEDGAKRYDVRFSADLKSNAAIILRRKKNQ